ncbi:MAG TPA: DUF883 family protein [Methylomirabilota bacterium]|nr:DUF883 family protein [Methylomirabilota bacterium]
MSKHRKEIANDVDTLTEDARALLVATSEVAGEKVAAARDRLHAALERGREVCGEVKVKAVAGAKAGDKFVRNNPYTALGIAIGVGAVVGLILSRRSRS